MPSRDELKRRLRDKINNSRNPTAPTTQESALAKAEELMMNMCGDDPHLLQCAQTLLKDPSKAQSMLQDLKRDTNTAHAVEDAMEEEEAPPPSSTV